MSGLKLGDLVLDPRRVIYISSLRAVVCTGLFEALQLSISDGLRGVIERVDDILEEYKPECFIILGGLTQGSGLAGIARRWGKSTKVQFVAKKTDVDARTMAEALGCEVHHDLIWGGYRFIENGDDQGLELQLLTISGKPHYSIKVGKHPFGGMKLAVFLKGVGRLMLPSLSPNSISTSVFRSGSSNYGRYDVFAIGHQRVLPMGKMADLKRFTGIGRAFPIAKATLGARRRAPKVPLAD